MLPQNHFPTAGQVTAKRSGLLHQSLLQAKQPQLQGVGTLYHFLPPCPPPPALASLVTAEGRWCPASPAHTCLHSRSCSVALWPQIWDPWGAISGQSAVSHGHNKVLHNFLSASPLSGCHRYADCLQTCHADVTYGYLLMHGSSQQQVHSYLGSAETIGHDGSGILPPDRVPPLACQHLIKVEAIRVCCALCPVQQLK